MPQPTPGDVHVNQLLTNIAVAYMQNRDVYIADRVFPTVPVMKQSDMYLVYNKGDWFRDEAQERAPGTESVGGGFGVNRPTYFARKYAFHKDVSDEERTNTDNPLSPDRNATNLVTDRLLLRRERLWVSKHFTTGVWGTDITGVDAAPSAGQVLRWNVANSQPVANIDTWRLAITEATGHKPNKLVIGPRVLATLKNHPDIMDRIKYTQRGQVTVEILASLFEVDEVLIPYGIVNTAAEGVTNAMSFIVGNHALLVYAAPAPSLQEPSGGYTFAWTGLLGAGAMGVRVKSFRMEPIESDRVEGEMAFDQVVVGADVGMFINTVIAKSASGDTERV